MNNAKGSRIATSAIIVMSSMVLSRLTGFVREMLLSHKVGLTWFQDAYVAAFTVPDLIYILLVGGTISAALVPFLSGHLEREEEEAGWRAVSSFINTVFIGMILLCLIGVIFAPWIIPFIVRGFSEKSPETRELAITLARILFSSVTFIMLAGICNGVLNSYKKFAAAAYGPSIYNIGCALSIYLFADRNADSMIKVASGVAASAFIYFLVQLSFALPRMKHYRPILNMSDKGFQKLFKQAVPSLFSSSITQVNVIISRTFVSMSLIEGSLSAFWNANTLWQLPYGIVAMGVGTAMLPTLSGNFATGELEKYKSILIKSLTSVLFIIIPSAAAFIVLREAIVRAVFMWGGKFTEKNVPFVAFIVMLFSLAMISQSITAIVNRAYYARQDTKTPLIIGIGTIVLNFVFCSIFYNLTRLGAGGMALSYSLISTVNAVVLLFILDKKMNGINLNIFFRFLMRAVPSSAIMAIILTLLEMIHPSLNTKLHQLLYLLIEIMAGSSVYFCMMLLTRSEEAAYFLKIFKNMLNVYIKGKEM